MRLIDADVLIDICKNKYSDIVAGSYPFNVVVYDLVNIIESQPLAYDIEKVVAELEERRIVAGNWSVDDDAYHSGKEYAYEQAISIVKAGGVE